MFQFSQPYLNGIVGMIQRCSLLGCRTKLALSFQGRYEFWTNGARVNRYFSPTDQVFRSHVLFLDLVPVRSAILVQIQRCSAVMRSAYK